MAFEVQINTTSIPKNIIFIFYHKSKYFKLDQISCHFEEAVDPSGIRMFLHQTPTLEFSGASKVSWSSSIPSLVPLLQSSVDSVRPLCKCYHPSIVPWLGGVSPKHTGQ